MASNPAKLQDWKLRFERFQDSGLSIDRFCKDENVSVVSFYYWKKRVEQAASALRTSLESRDTSADLKRNLSTKLPSSPHVLEFRIEAAGIAIDCRSSSFEVLPELLRWVTNSSSGSFQKLVIRN